MSVNGITAITDIAASYNAFDPKSVSAKTEEKKTADAKAAESGVIYEKSEEAQEAAKSQKTYKPNQALIDQLKADADAQVQSLKDIVQKMMGQQAGTWGLANGENDIWRFFAEGKFENIDEAAVAKAKEDISENGYWGVKQTSERILDFAKALTGGDPAMIDKMRGAFEKGFKAAGSAWGKDLPDISKQTYDAVMKGFDDWKNEAATEAEA